MPDRVQPSNDQVRDLEILIRSHHPIIVVETAEPRRASLLVQWVADRMNLPLIEWTADRGLRRGDLTAFRISKSEDPMVGLQHVMDSQLESLYVFEGFAPHLDDERVVQRLASIAHKLFEHRGAIVIPLSGVTLPRELARLATVYELSTPTPEQYYDFCQHLLRDIRDRMPVDVELSKEDVYLLLNQLRGLTLFEVKKVLTKAIVEEQRFDRTAIAKVLEAKKQIVESTGVLEYFSTEENLVDVAGLTALKSWLGRRRAAFADPSRAADFGLEPPRGVLLVGVPGCGKSLCAKAIASEWSLPLIRLDPSNLYQKYFGESERNLKRATQTAEAMAPIVLWIDEIEKAFHQGGEQDAGTSRRIFGTFLTWMQDKKESVFVVATSNDITKLPPEFVRKGRFDEIFFVDLPSSRVREEILAVHLARRGRDPNAFDLAGIAEQLDGFSGSEIEQVVVSSLYAAFESEAALSTEHLLEEAAQTVPLSTTAREKLAELRAWASDRAVPAD